MGHRSDDHDTADEEDGGLYALGCLRGAELAAFEAHLVTCTVCQDIVDADRKTLQALDGGTPSLSLPAGFRERLLQRARSELGEMDEAPPSTPVHASVRNRTWVALLAAALVLCLAAGAGVYLASNQVVASVALEGQVEHGMAVVEVRRSGRTFLVLRDLSPPPAQLVYVVWLVNAGGRPVRAATTTSGSGAIELDPTANEQLVSITLEPTPGSDAPTAPIILSGVVPSL